MTKSTFSASTRADIMLTPMGKKDRSICDATVEAENIFEKHHLNPKVHALATNVSGDLDQIFESIKEIITSGTKNFYYSNKD